MREQLEAATSTEMETGATAVLYLRVSSIGQVKGSDPEGYSIPGQREACKLHAERLGATVVGEYVEPGKSGTSTRRPELQRMLADLPSLKPTFVIVYDLSRVARDDFDALSLLRQIEGQGCKLESTLERVDDTPAGRLLYTVMAGVNAFRSRGDAEKVKMGLRRKHSQGGTPGAAPIGYLNVRRTTNGREVRTVEVDPERAPLVRTAFELYATGQHSVSALTEILESMGLRTPMTYRRPSRAMVRSAVHRMLSNDYYVGVVTMKGEKAEGAHPAIIDPQTFERVQNLLRSRALSGTRSRKYEHYLKGSIFCGICGGRMLYVQAKGHGGTYEYFRCFGRFNAGKECDAPHSRCSQVETAVIDEYLRREFLGLKQIEDVSAAIESFVDAKEHAASGEVARAEKRLSDLRGEQQKLLQLSYKGLVDDDVLALEQARIRKEQNDLAQWKAVAEKDSGEIRAARDEALLLLRDAPEAYNRASPEVRRLLNQALWTRFWVVDDEVIGAEVQTWVAAMAGSRDGTPAGDESSSKTPGLTDQIRMTESRRHAEGLTTVPTAASLTHSPRRGPGRRR